LFFYVRYDFFFIPGHFDLKLFTASRLKQNSAGEL